MRDIIEKQILPLLGKALSAGADRNVANGITMLLESLETLPDEEQLELAVKATAMIQAYGDISYNNGNIFSTTTRMVDIGVIYDRFPKSEDIALKLLDIISGVLGLKYGMGEYDNMDIYIKDILKISDIFPDSTDISLGCMMCYANIQAIYASTRTPLDSIDFIIDRMESISAKFHDSQDINLIYCRSLAAITSGIKGFPNKEIYEKYLNLLRQLTKTRKISVPPEVSAFLEQA